ncbi:MAG: DUF1499 domain-containing protein [Vibrio sp.]
MSQNCIPSTAHLPRIVFILLPLLLVACSRGSEPEQDRTALLCDSQAVSCVSTIDPREPHYIAPFLLRPGVTMKHVQRVALSLPNTHVADSSPDYLRIECTSSFFNTIDDLELKLDDYQLIVRSETRDTYPDLGRNKGRVERLRTKLAQAGLLESP